MSGARRVPPGEPAERLLDHALEMELWNHPRQWVAVTKSEVISFGTNPKEVLAEARRRGIENPEIIWVPDPDTVYVFKLSCR